jgi:hypothetical protein
MQLLASWKQSLGIFYPLSNLKLFGFAILRAIQVAVPQFFKMFWWLIGVSLLSDYFELPTAIVVMPLIIVSIYLVVRPSVGIKNLDYVKNHGRHILGGVICSLFLTVEALIIPNAKLILDESLRSFSIEGFISKVLPAVVLIGVINLFFVVVPLWFFFFLDSCATIGDFFVSWKRAFLMALYALPAWLLLFVVLEWVLGLFEMVTVVESWWSVIIVTFVSICVQIIVACLLSVFYTKRLHEQFELYFPGPQIKE